MRLEAARLGDVTDFITGHSNACGNPYQGTYSDINCPTKCFVVGNVADSIFGQDCWPCHNVCPPGLIWDTTNQLCTATPTTVNQTQANACNFVPNAQGTGYQPGPGGPLTQQIHTADEGCASYCAYIPFASSLFSECNPSVWLGCQNVTGSSTGGVTLALAAVGGLLLLSVLKEI